MAELHVHMGGSRVGVLDGSDPRSLSFTYDEQWVEDPMGTPLSVSLPKRRGAYRHAAISPYLWGLLPDNERVLERWARAAAGIHEAIATWTSRCAAVLAEAGGPFLSGR